jgi:putative sigma-54 modulation protein
MQINFTGHNLEVTPALRSFAEEKLSKLEHHFDNIMKINIVFNVEKLMQIAEGTIFIAKNEVHAHAQSESMYASIDELVDKLDRQLMTHKGKIQEKIKEKMRNSDKNGNHFESQEEPQG